MDSVFAERLLNLWERARALSPLDCALALVRLSDADDDLDAAALSPGARDRMLLEMHAAIFGDALNMSCECAGCGAQLELNSQVSALLDAAALGASDLDARSLQFEDLQVSVRLPNSRDLAVALDQPSPEARYRKLLSSCIVSVQRGLASIGCDELNDLEKARIAEYIGELDPLAEIAFRPACPECGESFRAYLDVGQFVWEELQQKARALFDEIHVLATAYGWTEREILQLSALRRTAYAARILA